MWSHLASRRTYGVPRIHAGLRRLGQRVNRKRVARVMRERDIRGVTRRKRRSLTRPDKKAKPAPDLIGRDFHAGRPGIKLVGDITYLPTAEGWLYLACRPDLVTREVVGYAMADHHSTLRSVSGSLIELQPSKETIRNGPNRTPGVTGWASGPARVSNTRFMGSAPSRLRRSRRAFAVGSATSIPTPVRAAVSLCQTSR